MNIKVTHRATKDLDKLQRAQPKLFDRVVGKIPNLSLDPRPGTSLVGALKVKWALRIGDYQSCKCSGCKWLVDLRVL